MKLRIRDNHLRLRLGKSDMDTLTHNKLIKSHIQLGKNMLTYLLESIDGKSIVVDYDFNTIRVQVPEFILEKWISSNQVGFDATLTLDDDTTLYVLVEKDFQCLKSRNEDESDLFLNPQANN